MRGCDVLWLQSVHRGDNNNVNVLRSHQSSFMDEASEVSMSHGSFGADHLDLTDTARYNVSWHVNIN